MDLLRRIARQPAKLIAFVNAVIGLGLILGWWTLTEPQVGAIMLVVSAFLGVVSEYLTPVSDPILPPGTIVNANTNAFPTGVVDVRPIPTDDLSTGG